MGQMEKRQGEIMNLFRSGDFTLHSGGMSTWKIDCDALSDKDWDTLAIMAVEILPPFGRVIGIPKGGLKFADALRAHCTLGDPTLIADDVVTTGRSMRDMRFDIQEKDAYQREIYGIAVFSRGDPTYWYWLKSIFMMQRKAE